MSLRAKKPVIKDARLKVLLYAKEGVGKTHFCCSFPDTYYIDTENLSDYPHLNRMIINNGGDIVYLTDLTEIIKEVKELLSTKHNYKTLIIDSLSFPYSWLSQMEVERIVNKNPHTEGTEFGANLAKSKRLTFQLGMLLSRLDMNVIVISHEKILYEKNIEVGKTYDITDKMAYSIGSVWNLRLQGKSRKLYINKSRYEELHTGDVIDFDNGYEVIKNLFGELIFKRESKIEELASKEQVKEFNHLVKVMNISDERVIKLLTSNQASTIEELNKEIIEKLINQLKRQIQNKEEAA